MRALMNLPLGLHAAAVIAAFCGFQVAKTRLDASYAASGYPVDYATGQLAFDATTIEGYYRVMIEASTLPVYVHTQIIDFGFIAGVMALALTLGTLIARLGGYARPLGFVAAWLGLAGGTMDAVENLLSFVMLADPQDIAQPLALAYSGAAATKFALLTGAMAMMLAALVAGIIAQVRARLKARLKARAAKA